MDHPTKAKLASHDEDRISGLPDEFIASILSRLTLKEAQATSILSKRWRYLWISHATHLDFDFNQGLEMSRAKFVEVVDKVLRQYSLRCDRSLHRFSVDYVFLTKHKSCIVRWIRFALSKQVKEIELRLLDVHFGIVPKEYMLSSDVFTDAGGVVETLQPNSGHIPLGYRSYGSSWTVGFRYLKHLVLKYVSIEGKFIDYLLANCSVLERLVFVNCSVSKSKLRISGQSLKLKVLYIERCSNFTDIEINDVNLVSLTYRGRELPLRVDNVPQLVELWIGEWLPVTPGHAILDGLSSSISHVQILKLEFYYMEGMLIPKLPTLRNVMQLKITLDAIEDSSLLLFTPLIEACPNLLRFTLKILGWWEASTVEKREERRIVGIPFRCLELVEFCGCYGRSSHYELVQYFIKNAVALRKLVVDPRIEPEVEYEDSYPHVKPDSEEYEDSEEDDQEVERQSREHAKQQLEGKLPSRIELMIC